MTIGYSKQYILCPECGTGNNKNDLLCKECNHELILNEKYYLIKILGENIGTTYLAVGASPSTCTQLVVVKELSLRRVDKWKTQELFQREGDILSQLDSPFIPKFIDEFQTGVARSAKSYLVIENIEGLSLREEYEKKRYTEAEVSEIAIDIAEILNYLHQLMPPVIHRDIKLSNIMRKEDGSLVLIDFGSVKDVMRDKNATISGTMGFMAPEQLMGEPVIASDFYSLGATILVLLSRKELEEMVENGIDLNWKSSIHTSNKMTYLLERLLEKDPKKRLNTLAEVKDILLTDKHEEKKTVDIVEKKANPQKRVKKKGIVRTPHAGDANSDFIDSLDTHYGYKKVNVLDTHYSSSHNSPYAYDIGKIKVTFFAILAIAAVFFFIFLANGGVSNYDDDNYKEEATAYIEHQRMLDERTKDLLKGLEKEKVEDLKKRKSLNFIEVDE